MLVLFTSAVVPAAIQNRELDYYNTSVIPPAAASAGYAPPNSGYTLSLDKTDYRPGETVRIHVENTWLSNPKALVTISNAMLGDMRDYQALEILYKEEKALTNGTADFEYTIPAESTTSTDKIYRYVVLVSDASQPSQAFSDQVFFFTKKDADKVVISDIILNQTNAKPGGVLTFKAKVVDGLGRPLPSSSGIYSSLEPPKNCWNYESMGDIVSPNAKGDQYLDQYLKYDMVYGYINISPYLEPGDYNLSIRASGGTGYSYAMANTTVHISGPAQEHPVFSIVSGSFVPDPYLSIFNGNRSAIAIAGKSTVLHFNGLTAVNSCEKILPNQTLEAYLQQYDIFAKKEIRRFNVTVMDSDQNGKFSLGFPLNGLEPGYYNMIINSTYGGKEYSTGGEIEIHDVKDYPIHADGHNYAVHVDGGRSKLKDFRFSKEEKKIAITVNNSYNPYNMMQVAIPHGLLDGTFTILADGMERRDIVQINSNSTHTMFYFSSSYGEKYSEFDIIGTSVVPEFGGPFLALGMAAVGIVGVIVATRRLQ